MAHVAVIGGGPAGLMAAEVLARGGARVTVYDRMPAFGRKFLLAGRGGLNLTHGEPLPAFLGRYGAAQPHLRASIEAFPPSEARAWCEGLGQETFVGSSGRVFPVTMKASPLLRAWLRWLADAGVAYAPRHRWTGWDADGLRFAMPDGEIVETPAATVLALGGASWPRLGSDGAWVPVLEGGGIAVAPLRPANCGFTLAWSEVMRARFEGHPLKRIALSFGARSVRGEAIVTRDGIEGGAVYALSGELREAIAEAGSADLMLDLRPDLSLADLASRLSARRGKQSLSNFLRKAAGLSPVAIGVLQESAHAGGQGLSEAQPAALAQRIKSVVLRLTDVAPIARAISSAGGVRFETLDEHFMLRSRPGVFIAGEMMDWEAPTGGYLLQACLATGAAAGRGALDYLRRAVT